ncbi:hypothetical protein PM3016_3606 [Paenibacillus mucilaginosus 3016]|uniref:Uncharacterized protein n=1 Tax=Paenibacillus mucilaginosus 3016 TaxID=1116391 RepID=H6NMU0_9BACL|nr:hypothetical protein [Paenibacillus mucilaginosus]AFC30427.1 hypothetical protein PM3016_3606 [Paenibacillus mucilaginosus 3016]WFA19065.1 hypothetical protein ERY13_18200 [Paenibacillus mucilaginosus]
MLKKFRKPMMRSALLCSCVFLAAAGVLQPAGTAFAAMSADSQAKLAGYWSPILYQDVGGKPEGDIPTTVNFDGDWSGTNNWENIGQYGRGLKALYPNTYWSLVESETHYFIGYNFFYATHDPQTSFGDHENDMEGIMLVVRKPGVKRKDGTTVTQPSGELELALMPRHAKLGMFAPTNTAIQYKPGMSSVYYDGTFTTEANTTGTHIRVYSAQNDAPLTDSEGDFGHALKAYNSAGAEGDTGFIFHWGGSGSSAINMNASGTANWDNYMSDFVESKRMNFGLIPMESSIWTLRNNMTLNLWASYGTFKGDTGRADAANAPWGWSFEGYRDLGGGTMLIDPAAFVDALFDDLGPFSKVYLTNAYK